MHRGLWLVAVTLAAALAAGCGGRGAQRPSQPGQSPQPTTGTGGEIKIVGKDNVYEPVKVTLAAGREYTFSFKNIGTTVHNYIIQAKDQVGQDFASDIAVNAGQDSRFKVKIDRPGTYKVICTYHPEMTGEVRVTQ
ncbi:MAG: cupredoxin domain-containing protein [Armatimonadota bacterium]